MVPPATYPAGYNVLPVEDALDTMQISVQVPPWPLLFTIPSLTPFLQIDPWLLFYNWFSFIRWRSTPSLTWTRGIRCSPQTVFSFSTFNDSNRDDIFDENDPDTEFLLYFHHYQIYLKHLPQVKLLPNGTTCSSHGILQGWHLLALHHFISSYVTFWKIYHYSEIVL